MIYWTMPLVSANLPSENHENLERKEPKSSSEKYSSRAVLCLWIVIEFNELSFISTGLLTEWRDKCYKWCNTTANSIWSDPQLYQLSLRTLWDVPCLRCFQVFPAGLGSHAVHYCQCFYVGDVSETEIPLQVIYPWVLWTESLLLYLSCFSYEAPKREIRSILSPPPGGIFPSHPASCCQSPHLPPCTTGVFYKCCPAYLLIATALLCVLQMLSNVK